ncbi:YesL family protein [Paenibacillus agilis]|uniref:DUF624 domain-containing protein n=1 Tax=Paenibacillus agilis TaxID=3020863 RepID=A0A559IY73_9BACL|nr:DUF624 domain-containing protein [Paenibacillus agilis]TVX92582.1 DUF624 domain-containing protein [Paenibacillus agilis]
METRGIMGGLYRISEWIMRISVTNILWLLCSAPFFFCFVMMLIMANSNFMNEVLQMKWLMGILAPFTLFPATAAMFSVTRKWVMGDVDAKLLKTFFSSYKANYKQAMLGGIFYTVLAVIMYAGYTIYMTEMQSMQVLGIMVLAMLVVFLASLFNFFSIIAHYHATTLQVIKNSIFMTIFRPIRVVVSGIVSVAILFMGLKYPVIIIFGAGSLIAYLSFFNFYLTYQKLQQAVEAREAAES